MPQDQTSQVRNTERVADMWNKKGSWLLLVGVAISTFLAGSGMQAWQNAETVQVLQNSFDAKEDGYRTRIRELNEELKALIPKVTVAADKATQAAETAKLTQEQVIQNGKDNSEASRP